MLLIHRKGLFQCAIRSLRIILPAVVYFLSPISAGAVLSFARHSVLASGKWVKISVSHTGIHQLSYTDLKKWGFSDPAKVKIYGFGGALLSENFQEPFSDDLPPVPVYRNRHRGVLLFYAQGPLTWKYISPDRYFKHEHNCYSTQGYYFLTENDEPDPEPPVQPSGTGETTEVTDFDDFLLHESNLTHISNAGRELYGEDFRFTQTQTFSFEIPGVLPDQSTVDFDFVAKTAKETTSIEVDINNKKLFTGDIYPSSNHYIIANAFHRTQPFNCDGAEVQTVRVQYKGTAAAIARLNYISLTVKRKLRLYDGTVIFQHQAADRTLLKYKFDPAGVPATSIKIWDITDYKNPQQITPASEENGISFIPGEPGIRRYVAFDINAEYPAPEKSEEINNQNLHALEPADMVIIVPAAFRSEADRLADFHRKQDGLSVHVVEPEPLYNEFSSGTPDATAYRLFMKMLYDRGGKQTGNPKYLLLFGDGSYNNLALSSARQSQYSGFLLTYQSNSLGDSYAKPIDDYFGFLHDTVTSAVSAFPEIGIGRFPVRTLTEATSAVDKTIRYAENKVPGPWKNELCFVSDDNAKDGNLYMQSSETICRFIENNHPEYIPNKIFLDSYKKVITANSQAYPDAKKQLFELLNNGLFLVTYIGHGSPRTWADEDLMNADDIRNLYNKQYPLFITSTCEFGRFDDLTQSAAEELFLNSKGGAIALLTTTRVVYENMNTPLTQEFIKNIFSRSSEGKRWRLGDIIRISKMDYLRTNKTGADHNNTQKFILLGDPALALAYPDHTLRITRINDHTLSDVIDTIKAKSRITMKGEILLPDGRKAEGFNGLVHVKVFDSSVPKLTLDNNGIGSPFPYHDRTNLLYFGRDSVRNGEFSFKFRVPKEINYSYESGLIHLYACNDERQEAQGYFNRFLVGGIDLTAAPDTTGPLIKGMYLNSRTFHEGDVVNETPVLIADLEDESGIGISGSSIGHDITLTIDDNPLQRYIVNNYFDSDFGQYGKGTIIYKIPEIDEGTHTLTLKVWDTENNSSEQSVGFQVKTGIEPEIYNLYTTENPARSTTSFFIIHDRPNARLDIRISVYNTNGIEVWSHTDQDVADMNTSFPITWSLTDKNGNRLDPGIYIYRAFISSEGGKETTKSKKLIILAE